MLGARVGAIPEMLDEQVTGLHFAPGDPDDLAKKVAWAWEHRPEMAAMGKAARRVYEDRYTANRNYHLLMNIYDSAIESHSRFKRSRVTSRRRLGFAFWAFRCMPSRSRTSSPGSGCGFDSDVRGRYIAVTGMHGIAESRNDSDFRARARLC